MVVLRELMDASSQRIIKILEVLAVRKGWITVSDLSSAIGASERTIAADLSKIRKQWGPNLNIESCKNSGVRLQNQNAASIGSVFIDLFNQSVALRWIKALLFHPNNSTEFYESELYVSRSTLIRLLPKINSFLAKRGMKIQCRNNHYQFLGRDEQYLRDFSAGFLLEMYGLNLQEHDIALDLKVIHSLILSVLAKNLDPRELACVTNDDISITYLLMFYLISLVREEQGYTVHSDYPVEDAAIGQNLAYLQRFFPHLKIDNLRPIHQFLFNHFKGWDSAAEEELIAQKAESFFQRIFSAVPISPNKNELYLMKFILKSLYLTAKSRTYKTSVLFDRIYYFSVSLKRTNPHLYQVVEENMKLFSQNVKYEMFTCLSDVLFWMCLICPELYKFSQPKAVLLIDDFGKPHAKFLSKVLSDFLNSKSATFLRIDIASSTDVLTSAGLENYDILISTIPNLPVSHQNIFLIDDYPSLENLYAIYKALIKSA